MSGVAAVAMFLVLGWIVTIKPGDSAASLDRVQRVCNVTLVVVFFACLIDMLIAALVHHHS